MLCKVLVLLIEITAPCAAYCVHEGCEASFYFLHRRPIHLKSEYLTLLAGFSENMPAYLAGI